MTGTVGNRTTGTETVICLRGAAENMNKWSLSLEIFWIWMISSQWQSVDPCSRGAACRIRLSLEKNFSVLFFFLYISHRKLLVLKHLPGFSPIASFFDLYKGQTTWITQTAAHINYWFLYMIKPVILDTINIIFHPPQNDSKKDCNNFSENT